LRKFIISIEDIHFKEFIKWTTQKLVKKILN
jgi:hypothetical protein